MQSSFSVKSENKVYNVKLTPSEPIPIVNSKSKTNSSYNNLKEQEDIANEE